MVIVLFQIFVTVLSVFLPAAFPCTKYTCLVGNATSLRSGL
jgi:hypothetical protein